MQNSQIFKKVYATFIKIDYILSHTPIATDLKEFKPTEYILDHMELN